ncbi:hypothetical protein [Kitasatospora sp. NPDC059599]
MSLNQRRIAAALVTIGAAGILTACGADVEHGTVTGKQHIDSSPATVPASSCHGRICSVNVGSFSVSAPVIICNKTTCTALKPEYWQITLRDKDGNTGTVRVTEDEYRRIHEGGTY